MDATRWEVVQLELKYCERCGGLWLRRKGCDTVFCASCVVEMPEVRTSRKSRRRPILPVNRVHAQLELVTNPRTGGNA